MDEDELVSIPIDNRKAGDAMPRHFHSRHRGAAPRRSALWAAHETVDAPSPVWGTFPRGFLSWCYRRLEVVTSRDVLHMCSGALTREMGGVRVDLRPDARPDVVADARALPFRDGEFRAALIDPPWSLEYARDLYGTDYPRPSHLLREACRVVRPLGLFAIVHFLVPNPPPGAEIVDVTGVTQGCGYRIRAFVRYRKRQAGLW